MADPTQVAELQQTLQDYGVGDYHDEVILLAHHATLDYSPHPFPTNTQIGEILTDTAGNKLSPQHCLPGRIQPPSRYWVDIR